MSDYCTLFSQTFYGLLLSYLTITDVTSYVHHKSPVSFVLYIATKNLKVKCNEISTIFLLPKNLYKKVSYPNMKQNLHFKINFARPATHKTGKFDDFRELHENEPEMAGRGVETKLEVLVTSCLASSFARPSDFPGNDISND